MTAILLMSVGGGLCVVIMPAWLANLGGVAKAVHRLGEGTRLGWWGVAKTEMQFRILTAVSIAGVGGIGLAMGVILFTRNS